ncbi:hypothetical protein PTSG_05597 [Salpingoeca rosetta]|uniref:BZIP domain-containing protein n=1 Tax=Salpingoeca rosetta (strain ATCC 50818 / BSB-021) TaxID=946362 RepID=F2UBN6_SALR5|nr:uncharacterized protein PTSG_05597 [Salpingoeca rosetta]EGD73902.1 hypothetical protein PTSG_05597 [Salpingoeca rosetta]|eukprot:XP_004993465.1 hypothetical protein PTSG_05597 [Salpingoeca rosetta]
MSDSQRHRQQQQQQPPPQQRGTRPSATVPQHLQQQGAHLSPFFSGFGLATGVAQQANVATSFQFARGGTSSSFGGQAQVQRQPPLPHPEVGATGLGGPPAMEGLPAPPPELCLEQSTNSLFRLLQEADPNLSVPSLSQIEGLSLEAPSLHAFEYPPPNHDQNSNSIIQALNLGSSVKFNNYRPAPIVHDNGHQQRRQQDSAPSAGKSPSTASSATAAATLLPSGSRDASSQGKSPFSFLSQVRRSSNGSFGSTEGGLGMGMDMGADKTGASPSSASATTPTSSAKASRSSKPGRGGKRGAADASGSTRGRGRGRGSRGRAAETSGANAQRRSKASTSSGGVAAGGKTTTTAAAAASTGMSGPPTKQSKHRAANGAGGGSDGGARRRTAKEEAPGFAMFGKQMAQLVSDPAMLQQQLHQLQQLQQQHQLQQQQQQQQQQQLLGAGMGAGLAGNLGTPALLVPQQQGQGQAQAQQQLAATPPAGHDSARQSVSSQQAGSPNRPSAKRRSSSTSVDSTGLDAKKPRGRQYRKQPNREDFDTDDAFSAAWSEWRAIRERNNAAVHRSREKAKARKLLDKQALEEREREFQRLKTAVEMLNKNVQLLIKARRSPEQLTSLEEAWLQTLCHSDTGILLASQCALFA